MVEIPQGLEDKKKPSVALATAGGFSGDILKSGQGASPLLQEAVQKEEKQEFKTLDVLKSAFAIENTIGSTIANIKSGNILDQEEDENYDVIEKIQDTKYEPYLDDFLGVFNDNQFDNVTKKIDRELYHRDVIESSGGKGIISSIVAGVFDPINLVPIGGSAYKTFKTGKVVKGIMEGGQVGALSSAATESILQSQQVTRTIEESVINVGSGALLGGLIGGVAGQLSKADFDNLANRLEKDMQRQESQIDIDDKGNLSVGSAQVAQTTLDQETLAGGKITRSVISSTKKLNPMLRILEGSSLEARRFLPQLVRTNMYFKKNAEDIATAQSVEIARKQYEAGLGIAITQSRQLAKKAIKRLKKESGQKLNLTKFNDLVSLAMIRGDKSEIPEVEQAARIFRSNVFDPLKDAAIDVKLLPEDVEPKTAKSYLMRRYNINKIVAQEDQFKQIIKDAARKRLIPDIKKRLAKTEQAITEKQFKSYQEELKGLTAKIKKAKADELEKLKDRRLELEILVGDELSVEDYLDEIANSIFDNIRGAERKGANLPYDMKIGARGAAKERVLTFVMDEEIRPFLETNIESLAQGYTKILGTDVELKRSFGDLNLEPQLKVIREEYNELRQKAKTDKQREKLVKEEKETVEIITAFKDMLRGNYGIPNNPDNLISRSLVLSRNIQYLSKLGGVAVSSIPDMSRHVMIHGYARVFDKGLKNLITNLEGIKLVVNDAKLTGNIWEGVSHQRTSFIADINDPYSGDSLLEKTVSYMSEKFGKLTLLDFWNDYQKSFSSVLTQQRLIENINDFNNIKGKEKRYLAFLGIDSKNYSMIKDQLDKHSFKVKDLHVANLEKWDDANAARLYKNALNTDVDRTIITKGVGDTPLFMNREVGKTIMQFKSFAYAAHQQLTIAGLQQRDFAAASGILTMITMGMLVYKLKTMGLGKETSDDPKVWLAEGIDRSGIVPIVAEINGVADAFGAGIGTFTGAEPLTRFQSRNKVGSLLGPSFGAAQDAASVSRAVFSGDIQESDIRAVRRNLPYQNIFYLRGLLNEVEEKIAK